MTAIEAHDKVWAKIRIENEAGNVCGTFGNDSGEPIIVGDQTLIEGLNIALVGMRRGETKNVTLPPNLAYGEIDPAKLQRVSIKSLPQTVAVGQQFIESSDVEKHWTVTEIHDEFAILNSNHPLAGQKVNVDIEIIDIESGTKERRQS